MVEDLFIIAVTLAVIYLLAYMILARPKGTSLRDKVYNNKLGVFTIILAIAFLLFGVVYPIVKDLVLGV